MNKILLTLLLSLGSLATTTNAQPNYELIVYKELLRNKVDTAMARIIVAVARHESANFTSKLFLQTKNVFGMTYPPKRTSLATGYKVYSDNGNKRKFCTFRTTTSSTTDFVLYLKHWNYPLDIKTPEKMVKTMKSKRYFEASEIVYLRAIKKHLSQLTI